MTREEAVARIKDHIEIHRYHERNAVKIFEALDMAIEALEQPELCEYYALCRHGRDEDKLRSALGRCDYCKSNQLATDCINREAAIEAIENDENIRNAMDTANDGDLHKIKRACVRIIAGLPPAEPEPRLSEWCGDCQEYDQERKCCPRFNRVIRETLKEAEEEQRWIPVSERLPEKPGIYLATLRCVEGSWVDTVEWGEIIGGWWQDIFYDDSKVVAWMPLPDPYGGKEQVDEIWRRMR